MSPIINRLDAYFRDQADAEQRRVVLGLLERDPGARLLDLGCADGTFTLAAQEAVGSSLAPAGIEIVEKNIAAATACGVEVIQGNLEQEFPVPEESCDVVLANQVIEHVANTDAFVKELYRVLKPGGYTVICTPNLAAIHNILFLLLGWQPQTASVSDEFLAGTFGPGQRELDAVNIQPSHRRIFTPGALGGLLAHHGFTVERLRGSGYFPLPTWLARPASRLCRGHAIHIIAKARKPHSIPAVSGDQPATPH